MKSPLHDAKRILIEGRESMTVIMKAMDFLSHEIPPQRHGEFVALVEILEDMDPEQVAKQIPEAQFAVLVRAKEVYLAMVALIKAALDDARGVGKQVIASCSAVAHFIEKNPEYRDLLRPEGI